MSNRIGPIGSLFLLSPFIAEFVLGNLPAKMLAVMLLLGLMYGTGAIFIRELVRSTGRGWLTLLLLATAYGFIEEGLVTQSLFNPDYMHFRLLDYGFIPALGIGLPWTIFVVSIHVGWSICTPIGLVECLFPQQLKTPWLKKRGIIIAGIAFLAGSAFIATVSQKQSPYMASPLQLLSIVVIAALLVVTAFMVPKPATFNVSEKPNSALLFIAPCICGSILMALQVSAEKTWHWPWQYTVIGALALETIFIGYLRIATRRQWTPRHHWLLTAGGISVYLWFGFVLDIGMQHGTSGLIGHSIIAVVALVLVIIAFVKTKPTSAPDDTQFAAEIKGGVSR